MVGLARGLAVLLAAAIVVGPLWAQPPVDFGRYHALVIGNDHYRHLRKLTTAVADAEAVAAILQDKYGFAVEVLKDATRSEILSALNRLRGGLTERDNLLIYYAGHGDLDEATDTGYWQPVDAEPGTDVNWIPTSDITLRLTAMNAKHILVVADSCYAGALLLTRDADTRLPTGTDRQLWLQRMASKRARTALTSGGLEPVLDRGGGGHSVFAGVLLEVLRDNEEILDGDRLFDRLKHPVVRKAQQTPRYADIRSLKHEGGDFLFVPKSLQTAFTAAATPAPPGELFRGRNEALFWESIKDGRNPAYFEEFLRQFPTGVFSGLARLRLGELQTRAPSPLVDPAQAEAALSLTPEQRRAVQEALSRLGFDVGSADGAFGPRTRAAIGAFQRQRGEAGSGYLTPEQWRTLASGAGADSDVRARPGVPELEMVAIEGGCFQMGSPPSEAGRNDDERQHRVCVDGFWIAKHETTVEEFRRFVEATGYRTDAEKNAGGVVGCFAYEQDSDPNWDWRAWASWRKPNKHQANRDDHPVGCVSWNDALAYAEWLSRETGKRYRLPTEAEWEYAARGGTTAARHWGEGPDAACRYANVADTTKIPPGNLSWELKHDCSDGHAFASPVGRYQANPFGLYDMLGNVWEWTCSEYEEVYSGAEQNCSSKNGASARVLGGGSWGSGPWFVRSANRDGRPADHRGNTIGFRLARSI